MAKRHIPQLRIGQAVAAYWGSQSFTGVAEVTTDVAIRFVKGPTPTIKDEIDTVKSIACGFYWRRNLAVEIVTHRGAVPVVA